MLDTLPLALQVVLALGLFNVWLVRARSATAYRGGTATNLKDEFAGYGLPEAAFYAVGGLKIAVAIAFIAGIWVSDLPALLMLAMSGTLLVLRAS